MSAPHISIWKYSEAPARYRNAYEAIMDVGGETWIAHVPKQLDEELFPAFRFDDLSPNNSCRSIRLGDGSYIYVGGYK